jgi:hypothetical protein
MDVRLQSKPLALVARSPRLTPRLGVHMLRRTAVDALTRVAAGTVSRPVTRRSVSSSPSTSEPARSPGVVGAFLRTFIAVSTLVAIDAAVDDYILYTVARRLASRDSTIDTDARLTDALGADYAHDGAWWNASVSRVRRSRVARVVFALAGERASCDVVVTMVGIRPVDAGENNDGVLPDFVKYLPRSVVHAFAGTSAWETAAVDCSLPSARGAGRSALVSLIPARGVTDGERETTTQKTKP